VLVNSYGKSISPLKIECMLRDIPGVVEALLIGEGKPYCSSLLWFDDNIQIDIVNRGIENINSHVSRPEEIKTWVALKNDLSIQGGDLTANVKLKRGNIVKRYENVIEYIYNDGKYPKNILHMGNIGKLTSGDIYGP
jgi:long-chain acyl-CoA synthetase